MVISVSHLTDQVEITGGGHARILSAARGPAFPPAGPPTPVAASDSCTLTPLRGYDDPFQFQKRRHLPASGTWLYPMRLSPPRLKSASTVSSFASFAVLFTRQSAHSATARFSGRSPKDSSCLLPF